MVLLLAFLFLPSLGVQPIPPHILSGLVGGAEALGTKEGYTGYGAEQGKVREDLAL